MKFLREPLLHFLALGAGLFLLFSFVGDGDEIRANRIVVSSAQVELMADLFSRTRQRPPTGQELEGLIQDHVREEVYYREAMAMGLDRDDTIVRRRLRQKLEFFTDELTTIVDPTEEQLETFLNDHDDTFRAPPRFSFEQIYFNPDRRGDQAGQDAESVLEGLNESPLEADTMALGDRLLLAGDHEHVSEEEIARDFGPGFASAMVDMPVGRWAGPVKSGFGLHLVLIRERYPGSLPDLAEIREAVEREWWNARRVMAREEFYDQVRGHYEVIVERPVNASGDVDADLAEASP